MSTSNLLNAQFDDSEDEDDFNPQPADLSDDGGDDDAGVQIRKEAARTRVDEDEGSDDEAPASSLHTGKMATTMMMMRMLRVKARI